MKVISILWLLTFWPRSGGEEGETDGVFFESFFEECEKLYFFLQNYQGYRQNMSQ